MIDHNKQMHLLQQTISYQLSTDTYGQLDIRLHGEIHRTFRVILNRTNPHAGCVLGALINE